MGLELKGRIQSYFVTQHHAFEYRNGWLRVPTCPFCGHEEKLGVHLAKDRAHCFRCDYDKRLLQTIQDLEDLPSTQAVVKYLSTLDSSDYEEPKYTPTLEIPIILPEGFRTLRIGNSFIAKQARNYVKSRGFDPLELSRKGVGYIEDEASKYYGYLIVPFYRDKKIIYFQTRKFYGNGPKFNNPKYEDFGIGKNQVIYNGDALTRYKEINILESWTNAWTLGRNSISLNGKTLSPKQLTMLLKSPVELFNILLDHDAWAYSLELALALIDYKKVRVVWFEDHRDVNDLGRATTLELIDQSPVLTKFQQIIALKNENRKIQPK